MKKKPTPSTLDTVTAGKVLAADLGNLLKKVECGVPLTGRQRALIEASAAPAAPAQPDAAPEDRNQPPRSAAELARRLGVSRQRVAAWAQRKDAPPIDDVPAWRRYLGEIARVKLSPDASEPKAQADPENRNPAPRLHFDDGAFAALDATASVLQAKLAPEVVGEMFGLIAAKVNKTLLRWGFKEIYTADDLP
jgi:transcriptional regulator with XRE-family HTH domain